jgi:hypothetical protein
MKNKLLTIIFAITTSLFFVSHTYSFQFGVGTRGFVKKVIEKGQEEGKIGKTKEEKEKGKPNTINYINYTGKLDKLDLSQAKYLFLAPKSTSTTSHSPAFKGAIYKADMTQTEKTVFKMKENGDIEEVNLYDEQGNRFDVNVYYIVKLSTEFISVALEIKGVWIVTTTTQVVNGSTEVVTAEQYFPISQWQTSVSTMGWGIDYSQYQKQYLVRLKDGAVFEGRYLPNDGNKKIYQDMYGNYYYVAAYSNDTWWVNSYYYGTGVQQDSLLKLNTKDMSIQVVSAQGDTIPYGAEAFAVDKYGNLAYLSTSGSGYKYRKTTATVDGSNIEHQGFYTYSYSYSHLPPIVDINRDAIYFIYDVGFSTLCVKKVRCNADTLYEIEESSSTGSVSWEVLNSLSYSKILNIGDKEISLLETTSGKILFPTIDLVNATTSYYYEVDYSTFGLDYNNFGSGFLGYQVVSSTEVYVLIKTQGQQSGRYRYTFYAIYPKEEKIEKVFYTERYEISQGWSPFSVNENGDIVVTATDLDTGNKNVLKITPNPADPGNTNNISILQQGTTQIYYLVRVY